MNDLVCHDDIDKITVRRVSDFSKEGRKTASAPMKVTELDPGKRYIFYGKALTGTEFIDYDITGAEIRATVLSHSMRGGDYLYYVQEIESPQGEKMGKRIEGNTDKGNLEVKVVKNIDDVKHDSINVVKIDQIDGTRRYDLKLLQGKRSAIIINQGVESIKSYLKAAIGLGVEAYISCSDDTIVGGAQ